MNRDPNEYTVTAAGNVYSRPKSSRPMVGMPDDPSTWRPAYPQFDMPAVDPRDFMERAVQQTLLAGIDDRGNPIFPLTQGEFREFVERRMDERRIQELLKNAPGSKLIDIMKQQGYPTQGV